MVFPFSSTPLVRKPELFATAAPGAFTQPVRTAKEAQEELQTYDYVVIGGGTAGCVLASRLSEDPKTSVLVIEAGHANDTLFCQIPSGAGNLYRTDYDWEYYTTPGNDKIENQELIWPRGKLLGGCSSINAMIYQEGAPTDYQEWEEKFGCKGYGATEMKEYHRRVENFNSKTARGALDMEHRSIDKGGLIHTRHSAISEIGEKGFIKAAIEIGVPPTSDINTIKGPKGVAQAMTFIDPKGRRSSSATAYLPQSVQQRPNLTVAIETYVTRILFDTTTGDRPRAIGVEVQKEEAGLLYQLAARKEVLVCAGALNTPQTLMLSGIGPREQLAKHGIAPIQESSHVGQHLKDHLCATPFLLRCKPEKSIDKYQDSLRALPHLWYWQLTGSGWMSGNIAESLAFTNVSDETLRAKVAASHPAAGRWSDVENHGSMGEGPDLELIALPGCLRDQLLTRAPPGHGVLSILIIGLRPQSEGEVRLGGDTVWDKAVIDANYFSDEGDNDRKVLLAGIRMSLAMAKSEALKPYLYDGDQTAESIDGYDKNNINHFYYPSSADPDTVTDKKLLKWMGGHPCTLYHPIGTARMGPSSSADDSVVDLQMKVNGVDGLRVCDASIFPEQISGHPAAVVLALAEKCADMVLGRNA